MTANDYVSSSVRPFLKWAGGKRWFVASYPDLFPKEFNTYYEPFLGAGSVYFHLVPKSAHLGDINPGLIETFKAIKLNWPLVLRYLREHQKNHSFEYYYQMRGLTPTSISKRAARFIYLNRTCWNGLFRVNNQGIFNVPIGTRTTVVFDHDSFDKISETLQSAELFNDDFERLIDKATNDDLIFVDPPYTVRHNNNSFIKYNEKLFSWSDQERLFDSLLRAKNRGAKIIGTNAFHQSLIDLYQEQFSIRVVSRASSISSKPQGRNRYDELLFTTENLECFKA